MPKLSEEQKAKMKAGREAKLIQEAAMNALPGAAIVAAQVFKPVKTKTVTAKFRIPRGTPITAVGQVLQSMVDQAKASGLTVNTVAGTLRGS